MSSLFHASSSGSSGGSAALRRLRRIALIARLSTKEAYRQHVVLLLFVLAVGLVFGAQALQAFNFGESESKFLADLGLSGIAGFGSVLTVILTAQLFFSELEHRTVLTLLAKPVGRFDFIAGKFLGAMAIVSIFCASLVGILLGLLLLRERAVLHSSEPAAMVRGAIDGARIVSAGFLDWLKFGIVSAFTLLIASYARSLFFTVGVSGLVLVVCHLHAFAHAAYAHSGSWVGRGLGGFIGLIFPDFRLLELPAMPDGNAIAGSLAWARMAAYALVYVGVFLALATSAFRQREL